MLDRARNYFPALIPLPMNKAMYETFYDGCAIQGPISAGQVPLGDLTEDESCFYLYLLDQESGHLEQEYLDDRRERSYCQIRFKQPCLDPQYLQTFKSYIK